MPRKVAGLTATEVKAAKPGVLVDGGGLRLVVKPAGTRFWVFRYMIAGKSREMGLGNAGAGRDAVTLSAARDKAGELRQALKAGTDPLAAREAKDAAAKAAAQAEAVARITFRAVAERYIEAHRAGWKNRKHEAQWGSTLATYVYPIIGEMAVADVATGHVTEVLRPIWMKKLETASRVRMRIEAVLDYAKAHDWRIGENPARWRGHLSKALPARAKMRKVEHHEALPWTEAGVFMAALRARDGMGARALEFAVLTAARSGEVRGATWAEIDMTAATWTVPAARMKAEAEHRVPLSGPALALLGDMATLRLTDDPAALVFPGASAGRPLSDMSLTAVLRRMKVHAVPHGFRSTFRDWSAEATAFPRELAEKALAHALGDKVEAAYQRGDLLEKRRDLMVEWARFCSEPYVKSAARLVDLHAV